MPGEIDDECFARVVIEGEDELCQAGLSGENGYEEDDDAKEDVPWCVVCPHCHRSPGEQKSTRMPPATTKSTVRSPRHQRITA